MPEYQPKPIQLTRREIERFKKYVDTSPGQGPNGDCHCWIGGKSPKGYGHFNLDNGRTIRSNRAAYFIHYGEDPYPDLTLHSCNWPPCCRGEHLYKGDQKKNIEYAVEQGRMASGDQNGSRQHPELLPHGKDHWTAKMPENTFKKHAPEKINAMRKLQRIRPDLSIKAIARYFGVPHMTANQILNFQTHKYLPYDDTVTIPEPVDPDYFAQRVLDPIDVAEIKDLLASGVSQQEIATRKGVSQTLVSKIHRKKSWTKTAK
jgi:hypothetical protein